jgi:hypothetical protein
MGLPSCIREVLFRVGVLRSATAEDLKCEIAARALAGSFWAEDIPYTWSFLQTVPAVPRFDKLLGRNTVPQEFFVRVFESGDTVGSITHSWTTGYDENGQAIAK